MEQQQQTAAASSTLHPVAVADLPFGMKVKALPGVEEVRETSWSNYRLDDEVTFSDDPEQTFDAEDACRLGLEYQKRMVVMDKFVVIGGLVADNDCENPLESCDAEGKVWFAGRRGNRENQSEYQDALGLDSDYSPNLELGWVEEEATRRYGALLKVNHSVWMVKLTTELADEGFTPKSILEEIVDYKRYGNWSGCRIDWDDDDLDVLDDLPDWKDVAKEAWEAGRESGNVGNPLAVALDVYEHSGMHLSVSGEGMQCRWDTTRGGAVWVPDGAALENIQYKVMEKIGMGQLKWFGACGSESDPLHARYSTDGGQTWKGHFAKWREAMDALKAEWLAQGNTLEAAKLRQAEYDAAEEYCRGVLESYNAWLGGECYGVCVYVIDRQTGEELDCYQHEVWGYIGSDSARDDLEGEIVRLVEELSGKTH